MNRPRSLAIDCDPGLDDAVAIALAAASPDLVIDLVTTVEGNAPLEMVTANAGTIIAALGHAAPVHRGHRAARRDPSRFSTAIWGGDGALAHEPAPSPASDDAVAALGGWLDRRSEPQGTLIALGPLTNLARLLHARPGLGGEIAELVVMGGAIGRGNATPEAELNIWVDPDAAATVLAGAIPATIVPLDVTRKVIAGPDFTATLARSRSKPAELVASLMPKAGIDSHPAAIHDACVVGFLLWPELFRHERGKLDVVTEPGPRQGRTVWTRDASGPHRLVSELDIGVFLRRMAERLAGGEEA
jgi:inosine-uridine nucleoside N-ribohydrolase